jgi:hypothetical protein
MNMRTSMNTFRCAISSAEELCTVPSLQFVCGPSHCKNQSLEVMLHDHSQNMDLRYLFYLSRDLFSHDLKLQASALSYRGLHKH